jgi:predicted AAA+ superfamily ATPase
MVNRLLNLSKNHSFFLLGARGTGKSTLVRSLFPHALTIDLLIPETEEQYSRSPGYLLEQLAHYKQTNPGQRWVFIDEVQKIPSLLDIVHKLIEEKHFKFALSGSSSRKLKRGQANLLAGRAFLYELFPYCSYEMKYFFDLDQTLQWGSLPKIFELDQSDRILYLRSYVNTYLKDEIVAEQLVRNLQPFRNFLEVAAQTNGQILNFSKIGRDIGVEVPTVQSYFDILVDTYIGFYLHPYHESVRKRQRKNPKFYLFDLGIKRTLERKINIPIEPMSLSYGNAFEHFIVLEIYRLIKYFQPDWELFYLRTKDDAEIDLVIDRPGQKKVLIEIKSTSKPLNLQYDKLKSFANLVKSIENHEAYVLSQNPESRLVDGIYFMHWQKGLEHIGLNPSTDE